MSEADKEAVRQQNALDAAYMERISALMRRKEKVAQNAGAGAYGNNNRCWCSRGALNGARGRKAQQAQDKLNALAADGKAPTGVPNQKNEPHVEAERAAEEAVAKRKAAKKAATKKIISKLDKKNKANKAKTKAKKKTKKKAKKAPSRAELEAEEDAVKAKNEEELAESAEIDAAQETAKAVKEGAIKPSTPHHDLSESNTPDDPIMDTEKFINKVLSDKEKIPHKKIKKLQAALNDHKDQVKNLKATVKQPQLQLANKNHAAPDHGTASDGPDQLPESVKELGDMDHEVEKLLPRGYAGPWN